MLLLGLASLWLRWRGRLFDAPLLQLAALLMGPAGLVALLAGWVTTEVGRQPFTIYGVLRTAESVSPIGAPGVAVSLAAFVTVYLAVFGAGVFLLLRLLSRPPAAGEAGHEAQPVRAAGVTPGPAVAGE